MFRDDLEFLDWHDRLYEKSCHLKKKDKDYTVNKSPPFSFQVNLAPLIHRLNPLVETEQRSVTTDRRVCISNTAHIVPSFRCPEAWCLLQLRGQNNSTSTTQPTASGGSTHP
ncbi:hypothetical protein DAPPUDRAFT_240720 [Daphnia pulex]|uniref:Uncharacterized protein n=1 Tax=Daphnia pulex TaxID=6669 RepID=E9GCC3_DAPPU|nr:hypothetical protein DAPPUDRAFT_240720 [Daphnia pulex]|eukprot:EFX82524.1 hypothetical protein DAPPUDRAFT_240720 [Daphnia pulex]